jgi:DNA-binding LacI/PurR family transcriptional regulator
VCVGAATVAITIKDIARRAGVSHSTVSRALRDNGAIPPRTARRIKRLAVKMGYVPSAAARSLKTSQSRALGVVVTNIADPFLSEVVRGIEEVVLDAGYSLFLAASNRDAEREKAILRALAERRADGAIICSSQVSEKHLRELERFGVPLVLVNNQVAGDFAHSIYHDDERGGREVTRHLLDLGHRRIAYLGNAEGGRASTDRRDGYCAELRAAGLPVKKEWILIGPNGRPPGGLAGAEQLLRLESRPTALFCYNDMMAIGVLQGLRRAGVRIPEECSVAGFDDVFVAKYADPPLTTFAQPKVQLGRDAAELMLALLAAEVHDRPLTKSICGQLLVRASTAPPPE